MTETVQTSAAAERERRARGRLGYSGWDRLGLVYPGLATQLEFEPIAFEAVRYEHRTGPFQAVCDGGAGDLDELAAEYARRVAAWTELGSKVKEHFHKPIGDAAKWSVVGGVLLLCLLGGIVLTGGSIVRPILLWSTIILVGLGSRVIRRRGRRLLETQGQPLNVYDLGASLEKRECPDCGYGLTGVPSALGATAMNVDVGPRQCPECVSPWPLVPPPAELACKFHVGNKRTVSRL